MARQYCGQLGKKANCQVLVTLAQGEVPIPVALRLFLPEAWTDDPLRCARAGVPETAIVARAKGEIALAEIDRVLAAVRRTGRGKKAAPRAGTATIAEPARDPPRRHGPAICRSDLATSMSALRRPVRSAPPSESAQVVLDDARDRFTPSMRQRLDLADLYEDACKRVQAGTDAAGEPRPLPKACPFTLDELLAKRPDVARLAAKQGGAGSDEER